MNTESLRNEVLVPAVAKTLDIAAKAKPTKEELFTTAKNYCCCGSCNSCCILGGTSSITQPIRHKENDMAMPVVFFYFYPVIPLDYGIL